MPKADVAYLRSLSSPPRCFATKGGDLKVSVIVATTFARRGSHEFLYDCFKGQTWRRKELLVFDDGGAQPSPLFSRLQDDRVTYVHVPSSSSASVFAAAKRDALQRMATGDVVAVFEDAAIYAPTYVESLLPHLVACGLPLVQLRSAWDLDGTGALREAKCAPTKAETMVYWRPAHHAAGDAWGATRHPTSNEAFKADKVAHTVVDDFGIFAHVASDRDGDADANFATKDAKVDDIPNDAMRVLVRKYQATVLRKPAYA